MSRSVTELMIQQSEQNQKEPSFVIANTTGEAHSVYAGLIMFSFKKMLFDFLKFLGLRIYVVRRGL